MVLAVEGVSEDNNAYWEDMKREILIIGLAGV